MSSFKIDARDGSARAGVLVTPHGEVRTPAFVPLATTATVKTLHASEEAALGSDIALAFDECTPFHVDRDYTARSTARTHRWLDRCIDWQREHAPSGQLLFGIVQGGVYEDLRIESAERVTSSDVGGVAV